LALDKRVLHFEDSALRILEELNAKREGFIIFTLEKKFIAIP